MKKTMFKLLMSVGLLFALEQANASNIRLGNPAYGGSGCPAGSAAATLSPGEDAISILFDQYSVESGYTTSRNIDRKSCNITVPVLVPQGLSVAIFSIDYRGFIALPDGASATLEAEYFWAGARGPRMVRTGNGPINTNYTVRDDITASTMVWSPCGQSVNLRINTSLQSITNNQNQQALATVDSADISGGLVYHLQWRQCR